jgi:hypothetical protein
MYESARDHGGFDLGMEEADAGRAERRVVPSLAKDDRVAAQHEQRHQNAGRGAHRGASTQPAGVQSIVIEGHTSTTSR